MACPFFYPTARSEDGAWAIAPRLPLGDAYQGECRAQTVSMVPAPGRVQETCNTGYARGCCDRFPHDASADAVRFHVLDEDAGRIRLQFTLEKGCWPAGGGVLEYSIAARRIESGYLSEILKVQAAVYIASYLRRRS